MSPSLIRWVGKMPAAEKVSFAEMARRALMAYDPEANAAQDAALEALAETLIPHPRNHGASGP